MLLDLWGLLAGEEEEVTPPQPEDSEVLSGESGPQVSRNDLLARFYRIIGISSVVAAPASVAGRGSSSVYVVRASSAVQSAVPRVLGDAVYDDTIPDEEELLLCLVASELA